MDFISLFASIYSFLDFYSDDTAYKYFKLMFAIYTAPKAINTLYNILKLGIYCIPYILLVTINNFIFGFINNIHTNMENYIDFKKKIYIEFNDYFVYSAKNINKMFSIESNKKSMIKHFKNKDILKVFNEINIIIMKNVYYIVRNKLYSDKGLISINNPSKITFLIDKKWV